MPRLNLAGVTLLCAQGKWQARSEGGAEGAPAPPPPAGQKGPQFEQPYLPDG